MRKTHQKKILDRGVRLAVEAAGSKYKLAKALGMTLPSLTRWKQIPSARVIEIERQFAIDREVLRPDLYPSRK